MGRIVARIPIFGHWMGAVCRDMFGVRMWDVGQSAHAVSVQIALDLFGTCSGDATFVCPVFRPVSGSFKFAELCPAHVGVCAWYALTYAGMRSAEFVKLYFKLEPAGDPARGLSVTVQRFPARIFPHKYANITAL